MWYYDQREFQPEDIGSHCGFVYRITNLTNSRQYIGKKLFKFAKRKQVKGKPKKILVDSDWKEYWGSNKTLQEDVVQLGSKNFRRDILRLCRTKGEMSYFETWYQFTENVLLSDNYYNEWISCKIQRSHVAKLGKV